MAGRQVAVPLRSRSDGDFTHRPSENSLYTIIDPPTLYLERVGQQWMQDRGEAKPGLNYVLERLPIGYALYERPRANGIKDKYLFGHPRQYFDSPNRFYPHFKHMMEHDGDMFGCPCTICDRRGGILPGRPASKTVSSHFSGSFKSGSSSRKVSRENSKRPTLNVQTTSPPVNGVVAKAPYKAVGRSKVVGAGMDGARVDEEGTPDVYRNLIDKLKRHGTLDEVIKEPLSSDWRADQELIPSLMKKLQRDPQWIPRVGDIVLYVRNLPQGIEIRLNEETEEYQLWDPQGKRHKETPVWEAGLVGQGPDDDASEGSCDDQWYVGKSLVRVEPLPNPNDTDKSFSKRYTYVQPEHTRPFFLWQEYVGRLTKQERHATMQNAFTVAATMSLVDKYRFQGKWPEAHIFCHGIYIGSELIAVGDTVRMLPKAGDESEFSTDVLVVRSIRLQLRNLDSASSNDYDEGRPYNSEIWIHGSAYTTVASRSSKEWLSDTNTEVPKAASNYGAWHPLHPPDKALAVPFSRIVGRLYEHDLMGSWIPNPDLDTGREGVLDARHFASKNDRRIVANVGTTWFWADSRADSLDLHTLNGVDVSKYDDKRDPKEWRKHIKIMEAGAGAAERKFAPRVPNLRGFMAPTNTNTNSLPMRTQGGQSEDNSVSGSSVTIGSKRRVIDVSEDEDEVLRQTRIVTNVPYKKHKIQVIVD
ncbi:hypothetical protein BU23DRAFT_485988 [Bimuria novae-zelandiae CBS 107.79]|uniref:Cryptic loci regulator 2 N-terminal domain-containing protein n=1 Tax=Bimuria novae-zelandiae CBS 107.79 TaxID=1447943 RepID=A0A6A5UUM1_9PLEO|nr:hypothetical protein BU23DRAFT_485988 [Bimuria novae-zelandiae CBS 107.79]